MFCTNCGRKLPDDISFCPFCGTKVHVPEAPAAEEPVIGIWSITKNIMAIFHIRFGQKKVLVIIDSL